MKQVLQWLKRSLGEKVLSIMLVQLLTPENIKKGIDAVLDMAEELAGKTETKIDDRALKAIRDALNIH